MIRDRAQDLNFNAARGLHLAFSATTLTIPDSIMLLLDVAECILIPIALHELVPAGGVHERLRDVQGVGLDARDDVW